MLSDEIERLWALRVEQRAQTLWDSGAHPNTTEMRALFLSCASIPGIGTFLVMAVQTGVTPNAKFYRGEHRDNPVVWPNGCPVPSPKRAPPRRPSKRALERAMREFDRDHGLFKKLPCGCFEQCPGREWHAEVEAAEDKRERELLKEHAAFDAQREVARRELVDELAHATLNRPVNVDPGTASEFACLLVHEGHEL